MQANKAAALRKWAEPCTVGCHSVYVAHTAFLLQPCMGRQLNEYDVDMTKGSFNTGKGCSCSSE
jgi:hypothetical protein